MVLNNSESPLGTSVVVPGLNQSANGWIWFRAQVIGSGTTTVRVRAWADGTAEPATWNFAATNSAAALQNAGALGLRVYTNSTVTNARSALASTSTWLPASLHNPRRTSCAVTLRSRRAAAQGGFSWRYWPSSWLLVCSTRWASLRPRCRAAVQVPPGFTATDWVTGFGDRLTSSAWSPDGRLFVNEKGGRVRVVKNGALLSQPFLTVSVDTTSERGLTGITFDPASPRTATYTSTTRTQPPSRTA
jgi:hypothetical protein